MSLSTSPARSEPSHIFHSEAEAMRHYGEYVDFNCARIEKLSAGLFEVVFTKAFIEAQISHLISRGVAGSEAEYAVRSYGNV